MGWLGYWLPLLLPTLKSQTQVGVFCITARFTQWCIPIPQQLAIRLALHQQKADELGGNLLGRAAKKGLGGAERCWEVVVALGVAMYGSAEEC